MLDGNLDLERTWVTGRPSVSKNVLSFALLYSVPSALCPRHPTFYEFSTAGFRRVVEVRATPQQTELGFCPTLVVYWTSSHLPIVGWNLRHLMDICWITTHSGYVTTINLQNGVPLRLLANATLLFRSLPVRNSHFGGPLRRPLFQILGR